jgi:hypothetical protein
MRAYFLVLLILMATTDIAAFVSADIANFYGSIAKAFFLVVPVGFTVGSAIGLVRRRT